MTLNASLTQAADINALVEAILGIIFLTTPSVNIYVTPLIPYLSALSNAF